MSWSEIPESSDFVKPSRVNKKIVEYYLKYAKDRDIERFMRLSSSSNASSADSECVVAFQQLKVCCTDKRKNSAREEQPSPKHDTATQTPEKEETGNITAPDSITKNGKRLEWDSLGDVGYKKASSTGNLSSLERSVLKELFSESPSEPDITQKGRYTYSADVETRKERWRQTLENLGKKYSSGDSERDKPSGSKQLRKLQPSGAEQLPSELKRDEFSQTNELPSQSQSDSRDTNVPTSYLRSILSTDNSDREIEVLLQVDQYSQTPSSKLFSEKERSKDEEQMKHRFSVDSEMFLEQEQSGREVVPNVDNDRKVDQYSQTPPSMLFSEKEPSKGMEQNKHRFTMDSELFLDQEQSGQKVVPNVKTSQKVPKELSKQHRFTMDSELFLDQEQSGQKVVPNVKKSQKVPKELSKQHRLTVDSELFLQQQQSEQEVVPNVKTSQKVPKELSKQHRMTVDSELFLQQQQSEQEVVPNVKTSQKVPKELSKQHRLTVDSELFLQQQQSEQEVAPNVKTSQKVPKELSKQHRLTVDSELFLQQQQSEQEVVPNVKTSQKVPKELSKQHRLTVDSELFLQQQQSEQEVVPNVKTSQKVPKELSKQHRLTVDSELFLQQQQSEQEVVPNVKTSQKVPKELSKQHRLTVDSELFLQQQQSEQEVVPNVKTSQKMPKELSKQHRLTVDSELFLQQQQSEQEVAPNVKTSQKVPKELSKQHRLTVDSELFLQQQQSEQEVAPNVKTSQKVPKELSKQHRLTVDSELFLQQQQSEQEVVPNVETSSDKVLKEFIKQLPPGVNIVTPLSSLKDSEKWTHPWDEFGEKYSYSTSFDSQLLLEHPQSTPIFGPSSDKYRQTSQQPKVPPSRMKDHSCQTSLDQVKNFGIRKPQTVNKQDHSCQTSFDKPKAQLDKKRPLREAIPQQKQDHACQTSFDKIKPRDGSFLEPNSHNVDYSFQTSSDRASSKLASIAEKNRQTNVRKLKSQEVQANIDSRRESFATQSSFEYHAGEAADSARLSARRRILSEFNSNARPLSDSDKENQSEKKPHKPKTEVDLGIKLLCSLIDAKNLSATQKKNLAKKIFEKIMKQQSSASTSTSITSRSSAFSGPSLIEVFRPPNGFEKITSESMFVEESKSTQQMEEQTQTEEQNVYEQAPTTSSSSREEPTTMREWLHPLTRSEKDYDKKHKKTAIKESSPQSTERSRQLTWIEMEINRLEGLKNLLIQERSPKSRSTERSPKSRSTYVSSRSTMQSGGRAEVIIEESAEDVVNHKDQYKRTTRKTSQNVIIYDEPTPDDGNQPEKVGYKTTTVIVDKERHTSTSGSMKNRRSKLETPSSSSTPSPDCQSVSAFANQLQKQFMEHYANKEHCVSQHYSEPRNCGKPIFTRNPSYTSVASSAFCVSSEMSIPIVESSSSTTTTHQYDSNGRDSVGGVAVQTTYSIIKTDPIFGPRCKCICTCGKACKCSCPRPTVRVSGQAFHQTVQVKPRALAYVIQFTETDSESNKPTEPSMTLQQRLEMYYPDFCSKADHRRKILRKLHKLRQEREQRIREIAEDSNNSSISRKLEQLPPPPIKTVRILGTKEMKGLTKKRYNKLPEVVAKQEREKLERRRSATRMITHIFNKKLQRMVHKGKLSLEYSRTVI